ncbi:MAG TPA: hypothetical protein VFI29_16765 [Hanamia sp.]|nr:hypothetical protein [Hanamia sp.]
MKSVITTILIILFSFLSCLYFPWWSIAIVAFIISALIPQKPLSSFFNGFIALFLLWGFLSLWISIQNGHILAHRVSLLIFKTDSPFLLILATALIGALVAGFAALAASYIRTRKDISVN